MFPHGHFRGKTVLDLGAGTGISWLCAGALGANVLVTVTISELRYDEIVGIHSFHSHGCLVIVATLL